MFVQSHFQRARHQAASPSAAPNHHHTHSANYKSAWSLQQERQQPRHQSSGGVQVDKRRCRAPPPAAAISREFLSLDNSKQSASERKRSNQPDRIQSVDSYYASCQSGPIKTNSEQQFRPHQDHLAPSCCGNNFWRQSKGPKERKIRSKSLSSLELRTPPAWEPSDKSQDGVEHKRAKLYRSRAEQSGPSSVERANREQSEQVTRIVASRGHPLISQSNGPADDGSSEVSGSSKVSKVVERRSQAAQVEPGDLVSLVGEPSGRSWLRLLLEYPINFGRLLAKKVLPSLGARTAPAEQRQTGILEQASRASKLSSPALIPISPSLSSKTRRHFELISTFCFNFIAYQLETWRLLADSAHPARQVAKLCRQTSMNLADGHQAARLADDELNETLAALRIASMEPQHGCMPAGRVVSLAADVVGQVRGPATGVSSSSRHAHSVAANRSPLATNYIAYAPPPRIGCRATCKTPEPDPLGGLRASKQLQSWHTVDGTQIRHQDCWQSVTVSPSSHGACRRGQTVSDPTLVDDARRAVARLRTGEDDERHYCRHQSNNHQAHQQRAARQRPQTMLGYCATPASHSGQAGRQQSCEANYGRHQESVAAQPSGWTTTSHLMQARTCQFKRPTTTGSDRELYTRTSHKHANQFVLEACQKGHYIHVGVSGRPPNSAAASTSGRTSQTGSMTSSSAGSSRSHLPCGSQSGGSKWQTNETPVTVKIVASNSNNNNNNNDNNSNSPPKVHSASSLGKVSLAGAKRRLGFKQKGSLNSLSVQRSEEILPAEAGRMLEWRFASTTSNSLNESSDENSRWPSGLRQQQFSASDSKVCFVEGLGVGQIASRQALVSPYLGDVQLSLSDQRGMLEVEVVRVRQLQPKPCAKKLPCPYVKVYLMRNKKCLAKFKTTQMKYTLDPLYQQRFIFRDDYSNCLLQVIVWAYYSKKDRKSLMGLAQIRLDDLDISNIVVGWYKLFNAPSMVSSSSLMSSSKALRQTMSSTKIGEEALVYE